MSMFNKVTKTFQWGQHTVRMETGEIARQSGGAVILDMESTSGLAFVDLNLNYHQNLNSQFHHQSNQCR